MCAPLSPCSDREKQAADTLFEGENTGINFDAYEDIPVEVGTAHVARGTAPLGAALV